MSENIASIGVKFDGTDLEKGRIALDAIAAAGPKVEAALKSVEGSAGKTGKTLASLGQGSKVADLGKDGAAAAAGMEKLGAASAKAGDAIKASATATKSAASSYDAMKAAVSSFTVAEAAHIQKLVEEYKQLGMNRGQLEAYKAAQAGMGKGAQEIAGAIAQKTEALKKEQMELAKSSAAVNSLKSAAAGLFASISVGAAIGKLVSVQREFDVLNSSLITVTGSSAAAAKEMEWLKQFAKETPFGLAQATQGFVKMKALGLDPSRAALTSFGNTASAMGKDLNQMIEAVADASTGEFERLKEFGIKSKKEGDSVAFTFQGVTTTIKNSAEEINRYLQALGETEFAGAMETRAKTLDGAIAGLGDTWDELFRTVSTQGVGSLVYDSVTLASRAIEDATTILRAMTEATDGTTRSTGALAALQGGVSIFFETVAVLAANTLYVLKQTGDTMGGVAAGYKAFFSFDFDAVRAIGADMKANAEQARREIDATTDRILNARKRAQIADGYAAWNASAATDPRRLDLPKSVPRPVSSGGGGGGKGGSRAAGSAVSAYATLIEGIKQKIEAEKLEMESGERLTASQRERLKIDSDIATGKLKISAAQKAALTAGLEELAMLEQQKAAAKEAMKIAQATQAARSKEADGIKAWMQAQEDAAAQSLKSVSDRIISLQNEEEAAKLSAAQNITLAQAIERTALARLREKQTGFREGSDGFNALQQEIEARERIIELISAKEQREAADASNKALVQQWDETVKQYDDIFRQGFADMLNKGEDGWKSFTKSLRTTFKTAVADQLYKSFAQPFVVKIVASLLGITGGGAAMAGGGGAAQNISNLNSLAGAASQAIWGGTVGASAASLAGANVVGAFGGDAIGALIAGNGAWAGVAVEAGAAAGSAAAAAGSAASAASSIGSAVAAAGPWAAAAMALYSIIKSFDDSGTIHTGAGSIYSADKGLRGGQDLFYSGKDKFGMAAAYSAGAQANVDSIAQSLGTALDSVAVSFGQKAGYEIATAFADDTSKDGAWGQLRISKDGKDLLNWEDTRKSKWAPKEFSDGEAGYKEYLAAVAKDTRQVLLDMDLPSWADTMLESIGETASMEQLAGVITQIGQVQSVFVQLGKTMDSFAGMTDKTFEALMKASGGIGALQQNLGAYYTNFYSESERMAKATAQLTAELAKSGISMPASKEAYRALVEQQLAAGEGGAELAVKLLQLSGAFAQTADFAEQAAQAAADAAKEAARNARDSLFRSLQNAIALERAQLDIQRGLAQESVSMVTSVFRMVRDNARSLYGEVQETAAMQAAQGSAFIDKALAAARSSGALPDSDALGTAIGAARGGLNAGNFASQSELEFQKLVLAGKLTELGDISEVQLSTAELTLKAAELQVKRLDQTLDYWRQQIDIANGNVDATLSVAAAVEALKKLMFPDKPANSGAAASSGGAVFGGGGSSSAAQQPSAKYSQVTSYGTAGIGYQPVIDVATIDRLDKLSGVYHSFDGTGDLVGLLTAVKGAGGSIDDLSKLSGFFQDDWRKAAASVGVPAFAGGGMHSGGLRLVGERGMEIEATGPSRIWNAQQMGAAMGGGSAEMVAELRALRAELSQLKALQAEGNKAASDTHNLLDRVTAGGNAMATEVMV